MGIAWVCRSSVLVFAGVYLLAGLPGCHPSTGDVSGTITIGGAPPSVTGIEIVFLADNGRLFTTPVHEDGTYRAVAVPTGVQRIGFNYVVRVANPEAGKRAAHLPSRSGDPLKTSLKEPVKNPIPAPLREASTSGLTFKVQSGAPNIFNYNMQP